MVRALLDGRKTQTRRLAHQPWLSAQPLDRLWVREAHRFTPSGDQRGPTRCGPVFYEADQHWFMGQVYPKGRLRPSIHMPRWASRLTLTVTEVRRQQLQEITEEDARAEGMPITWDGKPYDPPASDPWQGYGRYCFSSLWSELHGPGSWDANPEVIALTFTVARQNIDAPAQESAHA
jgi:hypothetical protein